MERNFALNAAFDFKAGETYTVYVTRKLDQQGKVKLVSNNETVRLLPAGTGEKDRAAAGQPATASPNQTAVSRPTAATAAQPGSASKPPAAPAVPGAAKPMLFHPVKPATGDNATTAATAAVVPGGRGRDGFYALLLLLLVAGTGFYLWRRRRA